MTRPNQAAIPASSLDDAVSFLNNEYDNPALVVSLLAKLSRKYSEPNVYTKIKAIVALHSIAENVSDKACNAIALSVHTLRREIDEKVGHPFFGMETVDDVADRASNVAELEAVELAKTYSTYVFDYIELKSDLPKTTGKKSSSLAMKSTGMSPATRAEGLMGLLER